MGQHPPVTASIAMNTRNPAVVNRLVRPLAAIATSALLMACSASGPSETDSEVASRVKPVASVDISRYTGTWYEIARLPNRFQDHCQANVTATYQQDGQGGLSVINRCLTRDGKTDEAIGRARRVTGTQGKLKVSFLPSLLSRFDWLPFGWGDYWILDLPADYGHSLVGSPDNKFLWVLSRQESMDAAVFFRLMQKAASMGYDVDAVTRTRQGQ